jgi:hypothetical protein
MTKYKFSVRAGCRKSAGIEKPAIGADRQWKYDPSLGNPSVVVRLVECEVCVGRDGKDKANQLFRTRVNFPTLDVLKLRPEFG